jgi:hypothetical protein
MGFPVHGDVEIQVNGQIIIANVVGPWNLELVQLSRSLTAPHINEVVKNGHWGLIVCIYGSAICPPDALELIKRGADRDIIEGQRVCTCYVMAPETEGYNLMPPIWRDIYRGKTPFDIFATLEEALLWSNKQLVRTSSS